MRVLVIGRMEREPWTDNEDQPRETWQVNARSVGILPYRIESVVLSPKPQEAEPKPRSEEHTSELQSLMRISYAVFCLKKKKSLTYLRQEQPHNHKRENTPL